MSLERRLRRHFASAGNGVPDPPDRLDEVVRRGRRRRVAQRATVACGALVAAVAVPVALAAWDGERVEFEPAAPPTGTAVEEPTAPAPSPTPGPTATGEPTSGPTPVPPSPAPTATEQEPATELPAPVLAYGPGEDDVLRRVDRDGEHVLLPGPVEAAYPDGQGGVVLRPASAPALVWLPGDGREITLVDGEDTLELRGVAPDGRVLYSVPPEADGAPAEGTEAFYAVALSEGATPEVLGSRPAYESHVEGPAPRADGGWVHAACHLHCSLWPGLGTEGERTEGEGTEPLYHGGGQEPGPTAAIAGLTATSDGRVVGFVESHPGHPDPEEAPAPALVLLDGSSFDTLARIELPPLDGGGEFRAVVSLSADAQLVLVTVAPHGHDPVPTTSWLVSAALTDDPRRHALGDAGILRWADPAGMLGLGGPVTAAERDAADRLVAFAREPGTDRSAEVPFAGEVRLGLGPDHLEGPVPAAALADPDTWQLDLADFRALAGPFSALDVLARAGEVTVSGGPHAHCAAPPMPPPGDLADLRLVSIQPAGFETCLQWWTVHLYLDGDGAVAAVTLDLWEP